MISYVDDDNGDDNDDDKDGDDNGNDDDGYISIIAV